MEGKPCFKVTLSMSKLSSESNAHPLNSNYKNLKIL